MSKSYTQVAAPKVRHSDTAPPGVRLPAMMLPRSCTRPSLLMPPEVPVLPTIVVAVTFAVPLTSIAPPAVDVARLPLIVVLVMFVVLPPETRMPPTRGAVFPLIVLAVMVVSPALFIAALKSAVLSAMVDRSTVNLPDVSIPPPEGAVLPEIVDPEKESEPLLYAPPPDVVALLPVTTLPALIATVAFGRRNTPPP